MNKSEWVREKQRGGGREKDIDRHIYTQSDTHTTYKQMHIHTDTQTYTDREKAREGK